MLYNPFFSPLRYTTSDVMDDTYIVYNEQDEMVGRLAAVERTTAGLLFWDEEGNQIDHPFRLHRIEARTKQVVLDRRVVK